MGILSILSHAHLSSSCIELSSNATMNTTLLIETFQTYLPRIAIAALLVGILINLITERSLLLFAFALP